MLRTYFRGFPPLFLQVLILSFVEQDETDEEDENWWMAAVNTASETELTYLQKSQQLELCSN